MERKRNDKRSLTMKEQLVKQIDENAKKWVQEAGAIIRNSFASELTIQYKSNPADLVTNMDKKIEQFFIEKISTHYPTHRILGEEGFGHDVQDLKGTVWLIDPIDGTMNFVHQQRHFAISCAVYHDGVGMIGLIYDVVANELYHAIKGEGAYFNDQKLPPLQSRKLEESVVAVNATWVSPNQRINHERIIPVARKARGTRSFGSAAIELAYVASGRMDAYMTMRLSPWDYAAGMVLLEEVGGTITTVDGQQIEMLAQNSVLASKPDLHSEILVVMEESE
jgi:myo-inositol-1(or 4)-monophosphatase